MAEELQSRLIECSPQFFEHIVVKLLRAMGYGGQFGEGRVTNYSHDGGIDGVINEDKLGLDVVCVQAKRWQGTVIDVVVLNCCVTETNETWYSSNKAMSLEKSNSDRLKRSTL